MKRNYWFWGFLLLLILNIAAVSSMFMHRRYVERECGRPDGCGNFMERNHRLKEELQMDNQQWDKFNEIRRNHHRSMEYLRTTLHDKHLEIFNIVSADNLDTNKLNTLKSDICQLHNQVISESIDYYQSTKSICRAEQIPVLNNHFRGMFMRPENPNCRPHHERIK